MAKCAQCGKRILLSGMKVADIHYCSESCADSALTPAFSAAIDNGIASTAASPAPVRSSVPTGPTDAMLIDRQGMQQGMKPGLVIGLGIVVAIALTVAMHALESLADGQMRGLNLWIVLPLGAALNGAIITSGFFAAIRLLDAPPRRATFVAACVTAGILCWLTYAISYCTMTDVDGTPIRSFVPFTEFMQTVIENSTFMLGKSKSSMVTAGRWGYALYAADCVGFMAGAWFVVRLAGAKPFCEKCGRFMSRLGIAHRSANDPVAAGSTVGAMTAHFGANNPQRAVEAFRAFGAPDHRSFFGIAMECHACPMCKDYDVKVTPSLAGKKRRRELDTASYSGNGDIQMQ